MDKNFWTESTTYKVVVTRLDLLRTIEVLGRPKNWFDRLWGYRPVYTYDLTHTLLNQVDVNLTEGHKVGYKKIFEEALIRLWFSGYINYDFDLERVIITGKGLEVLNEN